MKSKLPHAKCDTCPLRDSKQIHFDLSKKTDFVFMGMHGGSEEIRKQKVLVGPSGKIVRQTAKQLGFKNVSLINAVACAPEFKDTINEEARLHCEPAILNLIKNELKPKILFSMGPESLRTSGILPSPRNRKIEKDFKITTNNGFIEKSPKLNNIPVMMLIHPAYFLHTAKDGEESNADKFGDWVNALFYGVKNYFDPVPQPKIKLIKTLDDLENLINKIEKNERVAIDIESKSLKLFEQILCISLAHESDPYTGYIIPIPSSIKPKFNGEKWILNTPSKHKKLMRILKDFLEQKTKLIKIIMHGGMFDAPYFEAYDIKLEIHSDTLLKSHLMDESAFSHGLKYQARTKLSWPDWDKRLLNFIPSEEKQRDTIKAGKKKPSDWSAIPKHILYRYAGWDSPATLLIDFIYEDELDDLEKNLFYKEIMPTLNMYAHLRFTGVNIDVPIFHELKEIYEKRSFELYEELHAFALEHNLVAFNPKSSKQKAELLFDKMGFEVILQGKTGPSTDKKKVLERLPINVVTPKLIEFQGLETDISRYIWGVIRHTYQDFAIHPYYNLTLKTGRMSATSPSVLNIKRGSDLRKGYIAHKGKKRIVFEGDQSQCELRVLAGATNSVQMINAFTEGFDTEGPNNTIIKSKDIHGYFSKLVNPSMTLEAIEKGGHRTRMKNVVFGKVYRASLYIMAEQMVMSALQELRKTNLDEFNRIALDPLKYAIFFEGLLNQAEFISDKLDELCPELKDYETKCITELHKFGHVRSLTGRKRHIPLVTNSNKKHAENQACNSPIQDTANAINWHAMRKIYDKYQKPYEDKNLVPPIMLWFSVHDSIVGDLETELSEGSAKEILNDIQVIGEDAASSMLSERFPVFNILPFKVDMKIGTTFGDTEDINKPKAKELLKMR